MEIKEINTIHSPLALFEKYFSQKPHCFFLDSAIPNEASQRSQSSGSRRTSKEVSTFGIDPQKLGRFSFMGAKPFLILKTKGRLIEIIENGKTNRFIGNPFLVLKELLKKYKSDFYHDEIPFLGGAVGYFSYDLCHFIEKLPSTAIDDIGIPDCYLGFYDKIVAVDHLANKTYCVNYQFPILPPMAAPRHSAVANDQYQITGSVVVESNFLKESYLGAIKKAKEYIRQGDIYQVNLSQRFTADLTMPAFELYKRLRKINPAPFASYLDFGEAKIISASPERFLKVEAKSRYVETRPIKGTRPRNSTPRVDKRLEAELINSPKDRAEHVMIVDLERNDLGRVCEYGSVKWPESMALEKYATVYHLVSTVSGELKKDADCVDCLLNCFPGGSITGAPKIRSMEIIDELEPTKRSIYTGAIGYIGFNGNMDTSIVIRTFLAKENKPSPCMQGLGKLYFHAGGGIVADSDPEAEYQETLDKVKALIDAVSDTPIEKVSDTLRMRL
ncbi:MAG: aminodeoxychorismate synthase component I [Candidatus Omnitrophica bacterium]|nr:aminodeoxychorismate synthase component I [Candidatus Omnitrophota bacterium]